ncbi:hypothetical protein E4631_23365 [Hymenobacter sp. UV11]|uniref:hypothetical protein n=1 Tax=Hymenobacter sp. UV11 TaxID=1849735 RepID=UPI00105E41DA|nr:hypothetical protein [Hymenobacter sp. UV11]TDN39832.1 hypothetical protein A8B98_16710 [Hymenobacter sp. UV11]TFZ63246.1 hypothetical protein E4631_23365 [Hymenobacter sp. UV11]
MNTDRPTPEQLAEQIVANSAALVVADLKLKATNRRSDELMQQAQKSATTNRHDGRIFWLLMVAVAAILGYAGYLFYPF